jgi:hypothetical protein
MFLDIRLADGGEVVSLTCGHALPPGRFLVLISVKRLSQSQGHNAAGRIRPIENPIISSGIEPATFRHVA